LVKTKAIGSIAMSVSASTSPCPQKTCKLASASSAKKSPKPTLKAHRCEQEGEASS